MRYQDEQQRQFLTLLSAGAGSVVLPGATMSAGASAKPLRGIFPIGQRPFTESDKLDLDSLIMQLRFIDRGRVHGRVWPQLASEWSTLTEAERLEGAESKRALLEILDLMKPALRAQARGE